MIRVWWYSSLFNKIDEIDFYGEPNFSAGTQNKNVCAEICGSMPWAERNALHLKIEVFTDEAEPGIDIQPLLFDQCYTAFWK